MPPDTIPTPPASLDDILAVLREILATLAAPTSELLDREAFAALLGIGSSTLDRYRETGEIGPQPVRLGGAVRWCRAEVSAWLTHRDARGALHDSKTWPAVWASARRQRK